MKYHYRIFLWEKGQKTVEYTKFLTSPVFYEDRLNEELDTGEFVLDMMPISTKTLFSPKTKFRLERYKTDDYSDTPKTWDVVVEHDDCEEYKGMPGYCCHRIHVQEPSVVAQGMHVDNIALTYELQDCNLGYRTTTSNPSLSQVRIRNGGYPQCLRETKYETQSESVTTTKEGFFKNSYNYVWKNVSSLQNLSLEINAAEENEVVFEAPKLICQGSYDGKNWSDLFQMNSIIKIYRYATINGVQQADSKTLVFSKRFGPTSFTSANNELYFSDGSFASLRKINTENEPGIHTTFENIYTTFPILAEAKNEFADDEIRFMTSALSDSDIENSKGYYYLIECLADPANQDGMLLKYECSFEAFFGYDSWNGIVMQFGRFLTDNPEILDSNLVFSDTYFYCKNLYSDITFAPFLLKGEKYSCYDLFRKAMLTIDTQIINNEIIGIDEIEYPIFLNPLWENRLKIAKVQETTLETKNLWEVLLQIGYYLHAIPYLTFAEDGTDRFELSFKQLGGTNKKQDTGTKITAFNSKNLNDYFTQYDSYVTNIFSPQNLVDEWLVIKTNDSSALVSNNTAVLKTSYGISEIVDFEITYDGSCGGVAKTENALSHIFEKSVYEILTADYNISPGKGDSLFYELGKNEITGLTYVPPSKNNDMPMALKRIVGKLFSGVSISNLKFNSLKFHIKYRTQDSMRVSQVRPDIQQFMKNSTFEKYPHHEQYFGQQDKIIDSERFSLNLFGHLIRVGNDVYQFQEKVENDADEKESGDLVEIDGEPYYVTVVENEYYPDVTYQKVTYSKNFNQLSYIVTIPSEPRFYEVSERSKIRREVRLFDFFEISTQENLNAKAPRFLSANSWQSFIKKLIFNKEAVILPNYAWTRFMADKKRQHRGSYGQYIPSEQMFPSSELDRTNPNQVMPKSSSDHSDVIVPLLHFPMKDGIQFEWDMEDNFKAGDAIDTSISGESNSVDDAYYALQSVRYCDIMGRADLFTFRLFNKSNWTHDQSQALPKACIEPTESESIVYLPSPYSAALDKDGRCAVSYNYQISILYNANFITFSNLFGQKNSELFCCLLDREVSMFNENTSIISAIVLADKVQYSLVENYEKEQLEIHFTTPENLDVSKVKSIVFYEIDSDNNKVSYIAKNIKESLEALPDFFIYPVYND